MIIKAFGSEFNISFPFALLMAALLCCDRTGVILASILSVFFHELGHLAMLFILKMPPRRVNFRLCGIEIVESRLYCGYWAQLLVAAAGPIINILLGLLLLPLSYITFFGIMSASNFVIGVFNLLPLSQFDGGEILYCIMSCYMAEKRCKIISRVIDVILILSLIALGVYIFLMPNHNPTLLITSVYLMIYVIIKHR